MNRRHGGSAIPDRKGNTLRTAAAAVPSGEHAGQAGLDRARGPRFFPN
jgi:hypothetical protein